MARTQLNFRCTEPEIKAWSKAAKVAGLSLSAWIRKQATSAVRDQCDRYIEIPEIGLMKLPGVMAINGPATPQPARSKRNTRRRDAAAVR